MDGKYSVPPPVRGLRVVSCVFHECLGKSNRMSSFSNIASLYSLHWTTESGLGFGGILSSIGAGIATGSHEKTLKNGQKQAPIPNSLEKIVLTESKKELLDASAENLASSNFPPENLNLGFLDWNDKVPSGLKDQFNFILGCDSVKAYSEVDGLAKIVGNGLKSASSYVHIGPQYRESMKDLKVKLGRGYGMRTILENIALERFELTPLSAGVEDIHSTMSYERKHQYVEYRNKDVSTYSVLLCHHENGNFDSFDDDSVFIYKIESRRLDAGHALSLISDQELSFADRISRLELLTFADFAAESINEATSLSIAILSLIAASPISSPAVSTATVAQTNGSPQANNSWSQSPQPSNSWSNSPQPSNSWSNSPQPSTTYSQSPQQSTYSPKPIQPNSYPQSQQPWSPSNPGQNW